MTAAIDEPLVGLAQQADDVCALPLVRRLSATLDIDPSRWHEGDALPRGWHLAFFSADTCQSDLRGDGFAGLGVTLPNLGLPRIVFGGRNIRFIRDIPIGSRMKRVSKLTAVDRKEGRSGKFAVASIQHDTFIADDAEPAIVEIYNYVMREAAKPAVPGATSASPPKPPTMPEPTHRKIVVPDEMLLFRVSAVMFNPHRIHYDLPYATDKEAYPSLVVNASVTSLLLLEFFRSEAAVEPTSIVLRNAGLAYCRRPLRLNAVEGEKEWRVWADDEEGNVVVEGTMGVTA
jgi:3-methylfumaryl-CoA hydratase